MGTLESVTKLQEIFGGGPLAAFLGVSLVAGAIMTVMYVREVRAHQATLRELLPLTQNISTTWEHHLDQMDALKAEMREAITIFKALRRHTDEVPRIGS